MPKPVRGGNSFFPYRFREYPAELPSEGHKPPETTPFSARASRTCASATLSVRLDWIAVSMRESRFVSLKLFHHWAKSTGPLVSPPARDEVHCDGALVLGG